MNKILLAIIFVSAVASNIYAQATTLKLSTSDNTSSFNVTSSTDASILKLFGDGGFYLGGTYGTGTIPITGAGTRLMWYPKKAAFRAGVAETTWWDDANIGDYSLAMGYWSRATSSYAVAIGRQNYATGLNSLALGTFCQATGSYSTAIGYNSTASGDYSVCIGQDVSSNIREGAVLIGDNTPFSRIYASNNNEITMRFVGGYRFFSHYADSSSGVYMRSRTSGWSNYCDRNQKENFETLDPEAILNRLRKIPVTRWNYKKSDPSIKYIGPVAQDFYDAFQLGGTDSLGINSICIDGVNMAGVIALIGRTDELKSAVEELREQSEKVALLEKELSEQKNIIAAQQNIIEEMTKRFAAVESKLNSVEISNSELRCGNSIQVSEGTNE